MFGWGSAPDGDLGLGLRFVSSISDAVSLKVSRCRMPAAV